MRSGLRLVKVVLSLVQSQGILLVQQKEGSSAGRKSGKWLSGLYTICISIMYMYQAVAGYIKFTANSLCHLLEGLS